MSYVQQATPVQAPAAPAPPPSPEQLRQEINQTIRAAQDAARDAARAQAQIGRGEGQIIRVGPSVGGGPRGGGGGFTLDDGRFGPRGDGGIPRQAVDIALGFFAMCVVLVIGWPIARAFGRRLERKADTGATPAIAEQLQRIEQAVDAMSIEVERISESQRFIARLQNERLPEVAERQKV